MVKNLSQLKRKIEGGSTFVIRNHMRAECIGQRRKPIKVQTNGFYSAVLGDPANEFSIETCGKGLWIDYGKASDWEFAPNLCHLYAGAHSPENLVWSIELEE